MQISRLLSNEMDVLKYAIKQTIMIKILVSMGLDDALLQFE